MHALMHTHTHTHTPLPSSSLSSPSPPPTHTHTSPPVVHIHAVPSSPLPDLPLLSLLTASPLPVSLHSPLPAIPPPPPTLKPTCCTHTCCPQRATVVHTSPPPLHPPSPPPYPLPSQPPPPHHHPTCCTHQSCPQQPSASLTFTLSSPSSPNPPPHPYPPPSHPTTPPPHLLYTSVLSLAAVCLTYLYSLLSLLSPAACVSGKFSIICSPLSLLLLLLLLCVCLYVCVLWGQKWGNSKMVRCVNVDCDGPFGLPRWITWGVHQRSDAPEHSDAKGVADDRSRCCVMRSQTVSSCRVALCGCHFCARPVTALVLGVFRRSWAQRRERSRRMTAPTAMRCSPKWFRHFVWRRVVGISVHSQCQLWF